MALSSSPRKVIPLSVGDESWPASSTGAPSVTKRVFFCGVVVENIGHGHEYSQDVQDLVASLGEPLGTESNPQLATPDLGYESNVETSQVPQSRKRAMTDSTALSSVITELVNTERSYVHRLRLLKQEYADPLRTFARSKDTAIISPYDAKTLFGNVDNLLPVNEAFLADLEQMMTSEGPETVGGVGDVALHHFRDLRGFDQYKQYYVKREEAQSIFEREMMKKSSGFAAFVDRIKYSNADVKNRIGLRELLMDPVQRIPRYTLLFRMMIKHMAPSDPQHALLVQADEIASKIALAEMDEQTKRAAVLNCLCATVDNFPPALYSNSRRFVDCIDVDDLLADSQLHASGGHSTNSSSGALHATLILFDDKLMILKRPGHGERSGRALAGLDELEKMTKSGGLPLGMKKNGLSCKGVLDLVDIVATDVGPSSFHLYFETPPHDESDRWSGRPFRSFLVVFPPSLAGMVPTKTESAKRRFLENLWDLQARYRARLGLSVVLCAEEQEVESKRGRVTLARTYFNVYQRTSFLKEAKKPKLVVHIDEFGAADPLPFGTGSAPHVIIRIQPMAGNLSRYVVSSSDPNDDGEEDIVQTARVPARIVQTTHQYGLFKFRTESNSAPATPSASTRSRAAIFGLDAISRNLFNTRPGSNKGDIFGGSVASRRSRSIVSRSNTTASSSTSGDGSIAKFSQSSQSTAATSIYDDDASAAGSVKSRSLSRSRRLVKRSKSAGLSGDYGDFDRPSSRLSQSTTLDERAHSDPEPDQSDEEQDNEDIGNGRARESEWDLKRRLDLARQNSQQQAQEILHEPELDDLAYDDAPPQPLRPPSRASRDTSSYRSVTPTPQPFSPSDDRPLSPMPMLAASTSSDRRPGGPRSVSPMPLQSPRATLPQVPLLDVGSLALDGTSTSEDEGPFPSSPLEARSPIPRSRRVPLEPLGNVDATPKPSTSKSLTDSKNSSAVTPLLIRKKSIRGDGSPVRKAHSKAFNSVGGNLPLARPSPRPAGSSQPPSQLRVTRTQMLRSGEDIGDLKSRVTQLAQTTRADLESARNAVRRLKAELAQLQESSGDEGGDSRPSTPLGRSRIPTRTPQTPVTREAQQRMDEMRKLIAKRGTHARTRSMSEEVSPTFEPSKSGMMRSVHELATEAEDRLVQAAANHELCAGDLQAVLDDNTSKAAQVDALMLEHRSSQRQCEVIKDLLDNSTAENDAIYQTVNEELQALFDNLQLPPDQALSAVTEDLHQSKHSEYALAQENTQLKRQLAEFKLQQEQWGMLLRAHGLIS